MENYNYLLGYGVLAIFLLISAFQVLMLCNLKRFNANSVMSISLISSSVGTVVFMLYVPYCESFMSFLFVFISWAVLVSLSVMLFVLGLIKASFYINFFYSKGILKTGAKAFALISEKYQKDFDLEDVMVYRSKKGFGCYWVLDVRTYVAVSFDGFVKDDWKHEEMERCQAGDLIALSKYYQAKLVVTKRGVFKLVPTWKF